jgi:hypothetical protein
MTTNTPFKGYDKTCGATTRGGKQCGRPAGWGTTHVGSGTCKLHLGSVQTHIVKAQRERVTEAAALMGVPTDVDPHEGLLRMLAVASGGGQGGIPEHKPNVLVKMHTDAVDRVTRIAKTCADAGVQERAIRVVEDNAEQIANVLRRFATLAGLDVAEPGVQRAARLALTQDVIEGTAT